MRHSVAACATLLFATAVVAAEPVYQAADEVGVRFTPLQELQRAREFWTANPTSPAAPRAALDQVVAAVVLRDEEAADRARAALLIDYPYSLQAEFVRASFKKDEELGELLVREFSCRERELTPMFLHKFAEAAKRTPEKVRWQLQKNDKYMVALAYALFAIEEKGSTAADWKTRVTEEAYPIIVAAISGAKEDHQERYLALQQWPKNEAAQAIQRSLFPRIQTRNRTAEIVAVQAENLTFAGFFDDTLELIAATPEERRSARVRYWHAFALAGAGKYDDAVAALEPTDRDAADDPWVAGAAELRERIRELPKALEELPAVVRSVIDDVLARPPQAIELAISAGGAQDKELYFAYDSQQNSFEFAEVRAGKVQFGYRCEGLKGTIYTPGAAKLRTFAKGRWAPDFRWSLKESPTGEMNFKFGVNFSTDVQDNLGALLDPLREQSKLLDEDGLRRFFRSSIAARTLCTPVGKTDDGRRFTLLTQGRGEPKLNPLAVRVSPQGKLLGLDYEGLKMTRLRYGASGDFKCERPAWPDLPEEQAESLESADMMALMTAALKIVEEWAGAKATITDGE